MRSKGSVVAVVMLAALVATTFVAISPQARAAAPYIQRSLEHAQIANISWATCQGGLSIPGPPCSSTGILAISADDPTGRPVPAYLHIDLQSLTPAAGYPPGFMWFHSDFGITFDGAQLAVDPSLATAAASGQLSVRSCDQLWDTAAKPAQPRTPLQCSSERWQVDPEWTAICNGYARYHGGGIAGHDWDNAIRITADSTRGRCATGKVRVNGVALPDDDVGTSLDTWITRGTDVEITIFPDGPPERWNPSSA